MHKIILSLLILLLLPLPMAQAQSTTHYTRPVETVLSPVPTHSAVAGWCLDTTSGDRCPSTVGALTVGTPHAELIPVLQEAVSYWNSLSPMPLFGVDTTPIPSQPTSFYMGIYTHQVIVHVGDLPSGIGGLAWAYPSPDLPMDLCKVAVGALDVGTVTHELGHCLGLADVITSYGAPHGYHDESNPTCDNPRIPTHTEYEGMMSYCRNEIEPMDDACSLMRAGYIPRSLLPGYNTDAC